MNVDIIRDAVRRQPFVPFTLRMNDGREFYIPHLDYLAVSRTSVYFVDSITDAGTFLEPVLIASLEPRDGAPARRSRRPIQEATHERLAGQNSFASTWPLGQSRRGHPRALAVRLHRRPRRCRPLEADGIRVGLGVRQMEEGTMATTRSSNFKLLDPWERIQEIGMFFDEDGTLFTKRCSAWPGNSSRRASHTVLRGRWPVTCTRLNGPRTMLTSW